MIIDNGINELRNHVADILRPLFPQDAFVSFRVENFNEIVISAWFHNNLKITKPLILRVSAETVVSYIHSNYENRQGKDTEIRSYIAEKVNVFLAGNDQYQAEDEDEIYITVDALKESGGSSGA